MNRYVPTQESLANHPLPTWYDDAKLGIFIHWGLYSVPAWAPTTGELGAVDWDVWFRSNPYAEWYQNTMRIPDSETRRYHERAFGLECAYSDFTHQWRAERWDPDEWAELFRTAHAKYVVLTTKHHDGYCLWPIRHTDFCVGKQGPRRDLVGDLTHAVRDAGMRMGLYYSGLLDWSFTRQPILHPSDMGFLYPQTFEYVDYVYKQYQELIHTYEPSVLWNDIGWPELGESRLPHLFAEYYNAVADGVINDRWRISRPNQDMASHDMGIAWSDFKTAEYHLGRSSTISPHKWEFCRGLGYSFGYNQVEDEEQTISLDDLVQLVVDVVSKNGNVLLNVGPRADGSIPEIQARRLQQLGRWLDSQGEAVFATRPWTRAEGETEDGASVRFTAKGSTVYACIYGRPHQSVLIKDVVAADNARVRVLGANETVEWRQTENGLVLTLPERLPTEAAVTCAAIDGLVDRQ